MEISGPNFGIYDARYLQVTQRERARSIKPNVFRETEDPVAQALELTQDVVALSPEAQELLRMLKKYGKNSREVQRFLRSKRMKKLIYSFKELRDLVYGEDEEEEDASHPKKKKGKKAVPHPMVFQISGKPRSSKGRSMGWTPLRELIDKMIVFCPNHEMKKMLIKELEPFGEEIIKMVKQFGVRIIVLPVDQNLTQIRIKGMAIVAPGERSFDGRPWELVRGLYDNSRRIMVIGEENIGNPHHSTARHEFAHAFDHAFSEKNHRRLPLSVQLWNLFRKDREGLVSGYAGTNPQEYFAESVEAYFRASGREELREKDPQMYKYLENLFGEMD